MQKFLMQSLLRDQRGVTIILVAICIFVLIGFGALALDIGHLCVARNELQDAADAGALRGARVLYNDNGTTINEDANEEAYQTARRNTCERVATYDENGTVTGSIRNPVEVIWEGKDDNQHDVQRGHWSFATRTFTRNDSTALTELWDVSTAELDADTDFINAVSVTARRQDMPIASFLARIFGREHFEGEANATAYIGFAGTLLPEEVDQPIAICKGSLLNDSGEYTCTVGRMINSGTNNATHETGGWTSFNQDDPCTGGTNAQEVKSLVCVDGNPGPIYLGQYIATIGGQVGSAFDELYTCWEDNTSKIRLWPLTLPVIDCSGQNNVGPCQELVGAVEVNIVWIIDKGSTEGENAYEEAPTQMQGVGEDIPDWPVDGVPCYNIESSNPTEREACWNDFVSHFNLQNADGTPAPYVKKSIYFLPDCDFHDPTGDSGGENFGILAKIPKLVQ